jgi:MFS family permease
MDTDLSLSVGSRYSILTMIFFIPYIIFQFPANIVIRHLGPAVWLPSLVVCWGAVTIGMGFTTTWREALGCRVILGVLEAGYYPGCVYLLSCWYVRFEVQKRFSGFYLLALLASGFSNILAWGLSEMKGLGGLNGWQWIFAIVCLDFLRDASVILNGMIGRRDYYTAWYSGLFHNHLLSGSVYAAFADYGPPVSYAGRSEYYSLAHPA